MYHPTNVPDSSLIGSNSLVHGQHIDSGRSAMDPGNGGNSLGNNSNLNSKQRLRWTHELHERFVDAVAQLGGPDREYFPSICLILLLARYPNVRHRFYQALTFLIIKVFKSLTIIFPRCHTQRCPQSYGCTRLNHLPC
jgi:hypothetical protein